MKGRDGSLATSRNLHTVLDMLQESFDPIVSSVRSALAPCSVD
jgi:hypothetical protein